MLVTVNNRLKFEIEIVHDLSHHPIIPSLFQVNQFTSAVAACLQIYRSEAYLQMYTYTTADTDTES